MTPATLELEKSRLDLVYSSKNISSLTSLIHLNYGFLVRSGVTNIRFDIKILHSSAIFQND